MSVGVRGDEGVVRRHAGRVYAFASERRPAFVAVVAYVACELAIWRPGISFGVTVGVVGSSRSSDYQVAAWSLEWWPWAILHGLNPLHTGLLWAPSGYSTTWITSVPVLSLLAAPVTLLAGPLVSYNLLMLAAPPCAALACYALCRDLCDRFWPALLGGFLFGFSPYVLAQAVAQHLNLVMVWPLPLLVLIAVRYCRGQMSRRRAIAGSAALLLFLFGSSLELFATSVVLGGTVLAVALVFGRDLRVRLAELALCLGAASAIVLAVAAPFVWLTLGTSRPPLPFAPEQYATDLANVLVPTRITLGGATSFATGFSRHFVGNLGERDGYLGVPLVAVCLVAAWRDWHRRAWIAATAVAVALALSLGPALVVAGRTVVDLPFALDRLPALTLVLPSRLAVFVILAAICLVVPWLARSGLPGLRIALGIAIALSLTPRVGDLTGARAEAKADRAGVPAVEWAMPQAASGFVRIATGLRAADHGVGAPVRRVVPGELLAGGNGHAIPHRRRLHAVCPDEPRDRSAHPGLLAEFGAAAECLPAARLSAAHRYPHRARPARFAGVAGDRPRGDPRAAAPHRRDVHLRRRYAPRAQPPRPPAYPGPSAGRLRAFATSDAGRIAVGCKRQPRRSGGVADLGLADEARDRPGVDARGRLDTGRDSVRSRRRSEQAQRRCGRAANDRVVDRGPSAGLRF